MELLFNDFLKESYSEFTSGVKEERGAFFTREEVVHFILDLAGYQTDAPLTSYRLLEPSFGEGEFLVVVVKRLLASCPFPTFEILKNAILALLRKMEGAFPKLEEAGCKVGIGVATGSDKTFLGPYHLLDVEEDRKLPIVTTKDLSMGEVHWRGLGIVNPFQANGGLVDLEKYPKLRAYLENRKEALENRHIAKQNPKS